MKALTLHRPWARYVASGEKRIENRGWAPPAKMLGETIAIHAGRYWSNEGAEYCAKVLGGDIYSHDGLQHPEGIIGTAKIAGWFTLGKGENPQLKSAMIGIGRQLEAQMFGIKHDADVSLFTERDAQWSFGPVCWVLREARLLKNPIPCRGFQKLWNLPSAVDSQLAAALRAPCPTPGCQWGFVHPGDCFD